MDHSIKSDNKSYFHIPSDGLPTLASLLSQSNNPLQTLALNTAPVDNLNNDLANLKNQIDQLKEEVAGKEELAEINQRLDTMATSIESATERGQELKAKVLLPPSEHLNVQLVPSYSLERLEEYRTDEKKIYVFLGVFLGGIMGILSNWATQDSFKIDRAAGVLLSMCVFLTCCLIYWAWVINKRVQKIRDQMFLAKSSKTHPSIKKEENLLN
ncbi:MAG: hypothetical protein WBC05_10700, partial [Sedimentisphaerales bacterium]